MSRGLGDVYKRQTSKLAPVIILAASEQRKRAAEAISSGIENRPNGIVERNFPLISGVSSPKNDFSRGVSPATGLMTFTLIPKGASSTAIVFDARIIHPFDELYQFRFGLGETPAVLAIFRITPLLFSLKWGTKCFAVR